MLDPLVVNQMFDRHRRRVDAYDTLTPRERDVLALMAEGRSNVAVAAALHVTEGAVEKHTQRIFAKLGLHADAGSHRRVQAVLGWLRASTA